MSNLTTSQGGNETLIENPNLCTLQTCDLSLASFLYIPNLAGNALYLAIFVILFVLQMGLGLRGRTWGFMFAIFMGLALEVVGYAGRVMLHSNPFDNNAFLIYLICVTIAPAFITAAIYLCLSHIVAAYGAHFSRFKPRTYMLIFCSCDLFSLVLQGLGGGIAATANSNSGGNLGKNIMVAGLAVQVASLFLFTTCCGEFAMRVRRNRGAWNPRFLDLVRSRRFKIFLFALGLAVFTITVRSIFRCAELSEGFNGKLFNEQVPFMLLEGPMIIIAVAGLTVLHPGVAFQGRWREANFVLWTKFTFRSERFHGSDKAGAMELTDQLVGMPRVENVLMERKN